MKLQTAALLAIYAIGAAPAVAQSEPSARRITLLCNMEDPSCGPLLQKAYDDAVANPTVLGCTGSGVSSPRCPSGSYLSPVITCNFAGEPKPTVQELFGFWMFAIRYELMPYNFAELSARIGMIYALNSSRRC